MASELSPLSEEYLDQLVAKGAYSSRDAALEAAVAALREKNAQVLPVPDEHMEQVEQAIESSRAGESRPLTAAAWDQLRELARETARNSGQSDPG